MQLFTERRRCDTVVAADEDQRRTVNRLEQRRRVRTRHQGGQGAGNRLGRVGQRQRAHAFDNVRLLLPGGVGQQLRQHLGRDGGHSFFAHQRDHALASVDAFRSVGLRSRVGEHQSADVARRVAEEREGDVAAHRLAADHGVFDVQRVEEIDDIGCVVINGRGRWIGSAAVHAAKLGRDHAPAAFGQRELRLPHARVQRKGVDENEAAARASRARRGTWRRFEISEPADSWHDSDCERSPAPCRAGPFSGFRISRVRPSPDSARTTNGCSAPHRRTPDERARHCGTR